MTMTQSYVEAPAVSARLAGMEPVVHGGLSLEELMRCRVLKKAAWTPTAGTR